MPESKFFVWARGRWRELDLFSGSVHGAGGPVRFLYVSGGRLQAARAPRVLRALRALAEGRPSAAKDGMPLPKRRCLRRRTPRSRSKRQHCCCAAHTHQCNISFSEAPKVNITPAVPTPRIDAAIQVTELPTLQKNTQGSILVKSPKGETAQVPPRPRAKRKRTPSPKKRVVSDSSSEEPTLAALKLQDRCKELLINEEDVDLYRTYLLNHDPDFDVYRFDTDDSFKMRLFFLINPLVSLVPCKQLEAMLQQRRQSQDTISLKDFATKLGLRSISDQESENNKRYKMRRRVNTSVPTRSSTSDEETNKENFIQNRSEPPLPKSKYVATEKKDTSEKKKDVPVEGESKRKDTSDKEKSKTVDRTLRKRLMVAAVQRNIGSMDKTSKPNVENKKKHLPKKISSSSDSGRELAAKKSRFFTKKPTVKILPKSLSQGSKRSCGGREYSALEDHSIVAYVSSGERARRVNGNQLWRELQAQFDRLTGQRRSWHSLRNRYLRYILPSLGKLALEPDLIARMRASAAKGELKARKQPSAPNPLLAAPRVRSAFGARARSPSPSLSRSPTPAPAPAPAPPPPTEERVLRTRKSNTNTPTTVSAPVSAPKAVPVPPQRRSLRSSGACVPPSSPPAPAPAPGVPQARVRPRMRKLFNPNSPMH